MLCLCHGCSFSFQLKSHLCLQWKDRAEGRIQMLFQVSAAACLSTSTPLPGHSLCTAGDDPPCFPFFFFSMLTQQTKTIHRPSFLDVMFSPLHAVQLLFSLSLSQHQKISFAIASPRSVGSSSVRFWVTSPHSAQLQCDAEPILWANPEGVVRHATLLVPFSNIASQMWLRIKNDSWNTRVFSSFWKIKEQKCGVCTWLLVWRCLAVQQHKLFIKARLPGNLAARTSFIVHLLRIQM